MRKKAKNKAAQQLGRKGGQARAAKMTDEQRKESATRAARARWTKADLAIEQKEMEREELRRIGTRD